MVKKAKKGGPRPRPPRHAEPNKFERTKNKKKFEVLGRKDKTDVRNVGKLRTAATEKRKDTLLVEYKQLRKSNAFIDRRFGEDDDSLTADERALLRFQKQRLREMAGSKFTLADGDGEGAAEEPLTHLGQSLAELDDAGGRGWSSDDDAQLDDQLTREMHFGGGFVRSQKAADGATDADGEAPAAYKSKKEVMEEVIAKSKMHKALKARQREEDDKELDALDDQWRALAGAPVLAGMLRPKGAKVEVQKATDEADKRFDVLTRELVYEAKAQPGDRTLTAEELADLERQRLEVMERERVKRQRGGDDDEDDFEGADGAPEGPTAVLGGGYAARRAKRARAEVERAERGDNSDSGSDSDGHSGSEDDSGEEGSSGDEEEEEDWKGLTALERRRRAQASGSHPLQSSFREMAAKLLAKHGIEGEGGEESEEESKEESEEGEESGDDEAEGTSSEDEDSKGEEGEEGDDSSEDDSEEDDSEPELDAKKENKKGGNALPEASTAAAAAATGTLTFTPPLPETYESFAAMAKGLSASDLGELLRRIRAFNAAALATEGRKRMQILYGCIVQHFAALAGASPPQFEHLDALVPHIVELTPQVPFYAAGLARARLQRAHQQMTQRLKDPVLKAQAWPAPRTLLLLRLFTVVYPVSDKRHPVLTPASLLASSALTLCPLARARDVATGLLLASLVMQMHSEAKRFAPEPLTFALGLLRTVANEVNAVSSSSTTQENSETPWLRLSAAEIKTLSNSKESKNSDSIENLSVTEVLSCRDDAYFGSAEFKLRAAAAAIRLVKHTVDVLAEVDALPEIMAPAQDILHAIADATGVAPLANGTSSGGKRSKSKKDAKSIAVVAPALAALAAEVAEHVDNTVDAARSRRKPLCTRALAAVPEKKQYNPRYEDSFVSGKDYDPDRERSERRRLQRELRREERGAIRELRKDAAFMSGVRDKDKAASQADLDASARRAMSFLQQQESDFKSGGQGGMYKRRKKK